ncbi:MAG: hypothetical protein FWF25_00865 [Propionibacteriaceae bacterium]|nr:hypothetical protein [Propionibacteriaceae bacterium]
MIIGFHGVNIPELQNSADAADQQTAVVPSAALPSLTHDLSPASQSPAEPHQPALAQPKKTGPGALKWVTNQAKHTWGDITGGITKLGHGATVKNGLSDSARGGQALACSPENLKTTVETPEQHAPQDRWHRIHENLQSNSFTRPFLSQAHADKLFWDATGGTLLSGHWPKTSRVISSGVLALGADLNIVISDSPLRLLLGDRWFDDGHATIGQPSRAVSTRPPKTVADLIRNEHTADKAHGSIQITTIWQADDTVRVNVLLPGTQNFKPKDNGNPLDMNGDLVTMAGGSSTYEQDVMMAMAWAKAEGRIPDGARVMLVGHSGGAMVAGHLAANTDFVNKYNITNVVSVAGPTDDDSIDPEVKFLEIDGQNDIVPKLDLGGAAFPLIRSQAPASPNHSVVSVPDKQLQSLSDELDDHFDTTYAYELKTTDDPVLIRYQNQLRQDGFLNRPGAYASTITIPMGRK